MKAIRIILVLVLVALWSHIPGRPAQAQDEVTWLYEQMNALRASLGLSGYRLNGSLSAAAQAHSQWMAATGIIAHEQDDGSGPPERALAYGYGGEWVAENIYGGSNANASTAWNWWLNSSVHYNAIVNPIKTDVGIGIAQGSGMRYYTLVFGQGSREGLPPPPAALPNTEMANPNNESQIVEQSESGALVVEAIAAAPTERPLPPAATFTPSPTIPTATPTITWTPTFTWTPSPSPTLPLPTTTPVQLGTAIPLEVALAMTPSVTPLPSNTPVLVALSPLVDSYIPPRSPAPQNAQLDESGGLDRRWLLLLIIALQVLGLGWVLWRLGAKRL
jgi:hypothetical protein